MSDVKVQSSNHPKERGQRLVKEAKQHQAERVLNSKKNTEAVVKDVCGFFKSKAKDRTFATIGDGVTQRQWDRIFGKKKRSTGYGTAQRGKREKDRV